VTGTITHIEVDQGYGALILKVNQLRKTIEKDTMPKKKTKRWSYSRWAMYHLCPRQYHWYYILKMPRTTSYAMERGLDIHKKAENFVKGKITGMPSELKKFAPEFKALRREYRRGRGRTEPDISMNRDRTASTKEDTDYFIGFADYAHCTYDKGEVNLSALAVIDYKTGRKYPGHREQGNIYALILLCLNPSVDKVTVEFYYLDSGFVTEFIIHRKDLERLMAVWDRRITKMYSDKVFEATPNKFCKWCNRNKLNGGDCDG